MHMLVRHARIVVVGLIAGVILIASATGVAAALGAFSETTVPQLNACVPSRTAFTTASGAKVLTGNTADGVYCIAYRDPSGAGGGTGGRIGATPVGDAVAEKVLDTASNTYVIAGVVPVGYTTLTLGSTVIPIENHAFAVDATTADAPAILSGPAGSATLNLRALAELP